LLYYRYILTPSPLNACNIALKVITDPSRCKQTRKCAKSAFFILFSFSSGQWGGGGYSPPAALATLLNKVNALSWIKFDLRIKAKAMQYIYKTVPILRCSCTIANNISTINNEASITITRCTTDLNV